MLVRPRGARALIPLLAVAALSVPVTASALTVPAAATSGAPAAAAAVEGACADDTGVTVVVDLTDLGGEVEVGCAPGTPATGAQALVDAGFTDTRDAANLVCAIEQLPDPCPAEFTGDWWSYWYATPGGEWQSYQVGPDEAAPEPGSVEGWRYSDGAAGPTIDPPAPAEAADETATDDAATDEETVADEDGTEEPTTDATGADDETDAAGSATPLVLGGAVVVLAAVGLVVLARRRRSDLGPAGQD